MHCPRCGQEQVSEEIKFCSRCGFPLGLVSEIVAHGGFLPQLADLSKKGKKWLTRNFGLKIALLWFVIFLCLVPLAGVTKAPGEITGGLAILGFVGALFLLVISFLFLSNEKKPLTGQNELPSQIGNPQYVRGRQTSTALPPTSSQPISDYAPPLAGSWKAPETGELVPRSSSSSGSVTEGTTRLLKKDE